MVQESLVKKNNVSDFWLTLFKNCNLKLKIVISVILLLLFFYYKKIVNVTNMFAGYADVNKKNSVICRMKMEYLNKVFYFYATEIFFRHHTNPFLLDYELINK